MADKTIGQFYLDNTITAPAKTDVVPIGRDPSGTPSTGGMAWPTIHKMPPEVRTTTTNLAADDCNRVNVNDGAAGQVTMNLPLAADGLVFPFLVTDASGFQLVAQVGETIRIGGLVSSGGGTCTSATIGSWLLLWGRTGVGWISMGPTDGWTLA